MNAVLTMNETPLMFGVKKARTRWAISITNGPKADELVLHQSWHDAELTLYGVLVATTRDGAPTGTGYAGVELDVVIGRVSKRWLPANGQYSRTDFESVQAVVRRVRHDAHLERIAQLHLNLPRFDLLEGKRIEFGYDAETRKAMLHPFYNPH